jgi:DNA uptake protein ComE-like DNA-binding protein
MKRLAWSASAALAFLLTVTPVLWAQTAGARLDLNTASQIELEMLPGVGPVTAKQIIAGRPYMSVADLSKAGVSAATIERITPHVKVGPVGTAGAATVKGGEKATAGVEKGVDATSKGVEKGVNATTKGIDKGVNATTKGVDKGVNAAAKGVQKGASATAAAADKVGRAITGAPRTPPQAGMVWVNTATKVYHKEGDPSYGKTKAGKWLTEQEAVKEGYRAAKWTPAK